MIAMAKNCQFPMGMQRGMEAKDSSQEFLPVPSGFKSFTSLTLQRDNSSNSNKPTSCSISTLDKFRVDFRESNSFLEKEDFDFEIFEKDVPSQQCLPKGIFGGYPKCANCQKVKARWRPDEASRPILEEAPVFYPTEEEFKDTLKYIGSIRPIAEPYGICRIVPPSTWKPPCLLKEDKLWAHSKFPTRIQQIDKLQNRENATKMYQGHAAVNGKKRRKISGKHMGTNKHDKLHNNQQFGFEYGPDFTLKSFQNYAMEFVEKYFCMDTISVFNNQMQQFVELMEREYWRVIMRPTENIEVLYGADIDTSLFGSGFPRASLNQKNSSCDQFLGTGWNLNNLPKHPGSLLGVESGSIPGVIVPWLYVGMCFSSFCWHVEDHHLYSLNYLHLGAPKVWYGIPGKDASKFESSIRKHLPHLFREQPDLLHNLVTQFSPHLLRSDGLPVYRCVQNEGQFVLTFPRAYHSGFNCGFNCAEAVNVAPVDWLPIGQTAVELYRVQKRMTTLSHDKLLLGAAAEAVRAQWSILFSRHEEVDCLRWENVCGANGILTRTLKARILMEHAQRKYLCCPSKSRKIDAGFDAKDRECVECHYDLHLSAIGCSSCPDRFACLIHTKQLCSCSSETRFFLFRFDLSELKMLVAALEGKSSAVHRWGMLHLGLSLSSSISRDISQEPQIMHKSSSPLRVSISSGPQKCPPHLRQHKKQEECSNANSKSGENEYKSPGTSSSDSSAQSTYVSNIISRSSICSDAKVESTTCSRSSHAVDVNGLSSALGESAAKRTLGQSSYAVKSVSISVDEACDSSSTGVYVVDLADKEPLLAKPGQQVTGTVEVLESGMAVAGEQWHSSPVMFPIGYKSRVKYNSVLDPTTTCYYISEILDAGLLGPLFMVTVEQCPSEVFVHVSVNSCWDLVRERVNQEIIRRHEARGWENRLLPSLQLPGSVDGLHMFGLSSSEVIQAIKGRQ